MTGLTRRDLEELPLRFFGIVLTNATILTWVKE
jgi:hypothetical protein